MNTILYVDRTGVPWRYLPHDFPPHQTVYGYFAHWEADGIFDQLTGLLRGKVRQAEGRTSGPSACLIDSQSTTTSTTVHLTSQSTDPAKGGRAAQAPGLSELRARAHPRPRSRQAVTSLAMSRLGQSEACQRDTGAYGPQPVERNRSMLGIAAAVLFFIAFLINAAEITTNEVFSSSNVMLLGLMLLALHVAGIGSGWSGRRR